MAKVPSSDQFWISKKASGKIPLWHVSFFVCHSRAYLSSEISKNKIIQVYKIQIQHEMVRMISTKRPLPHLLQPTGLGENISSLKLLELGFVTDIITSNEVAQRNWFRYERKMLIFYPNPQWKRANLLRRANITIWINRLNPFLFWMNPSQTKIFSFQKRLL